MFAYQQAEVLGVTTKARSNPMPSSPTNVATNNPVISSKVGVAPKQTPKDGKVRVMLCGTYPIGQSNGYSRVVYYISKYLGLKEDIVLTIYGFQNYQQTQGAQARNDIPSSVILHDALATENPKRNGFGEKEIGGYLREHPQDVVIIFNDMVVTSALVKTIVEEVPIEQRKAMKLVSYMDQVYPYQKKQYIDMLNTYFDVIITFTPYWRSIARRLGIRKEIPIYVFPHGFDHKLYFPIPRDVARIQYNIPKDAFAILNLNRNQPRKRWDHTMMAFANVVHRYYQLTQEKPKETHRPLRLVIATMVNGFWDLMELFEHELKLLGVPLEFGKQCIIAVAKPQQMSDGDINVLYNACDVGINTCEGEGWGLCQSEHAAVGCPQIAPKIGGMQEFLKEDHATLIEAKWRYYIDRQRDGIGGIAEIGDTMEYANAIWRYYTDPKLMKEHGTKARKYILQHFRWETVVSHFHRVLHNINASDKTPASL
jgi:glycosyltransferase involved in cell wall biosynthesis